MLHARANRSWAPVLASPRLNLNHSKNLKEWDWVEVGELFLDIVPREELDLYVLMGTCNIKFPPPIRNNAAPNL